MNRIGNMGAGMRTLLQALLWVVMLAPAWVSAETTISDVSTLTEVERREVLARLTDAEVRDLVWQFMAVDGDAASGTPAVDSLTAMVANVRAEVGDWLAAVPRLPGLVATVFGAMIPEGGSAATLLLVLLFLALILGGGWLAQRVVARFTGRVVTAKSAGDSGFLSRLGAALLRLFLRLVEVAAFVAGAGLVFMVLWQGHEPNRLLAIHLIGVIALVQVAIRVSGALWAPGDAAARLVPVADGDAARVHRYFVLIVSFAVALAFLVHYLRQLGVDLDLVRLVNFGLGAVFVVMVNVWMWKVQQPIAGLLGDDRSRGMLLSLFAGTWPIVYGVLTVLIYLSAIVAASSPGFVAQGAGLSTLLLAVALPFVMGAVRPIVDDLFSRSEVEAVTIGESVTTRSGLRTPVTRILRVALLVGALAWALSWWGIDLAAAFGSGIGSTIGQGGLQILAALVVAWLLWSIAKRTIDPHLVEDGGDGAEVDEVGGSGVSRVATLLPLLRKVIYVVLVTMTAMVILSALGVDIGPLLAGAGVIGLAVGFGAQSLVTDIISGIFFLMDDAFRRGEYIETGGIRGSVERISIRSCQLRHHNGPLHTVPYGQMSSITNYSRDWAIMKFELRVPFEVNVDRVRKLIKKTGQEMMADPEVAEMLLEPLKSQGVNRMDDSAFIVRCKFTAKPGKQFVARRIAYTKIQEAFQREGIHFAPRRVLVETTGPDKSDSVAAAAAVAAESAGKGGSADDRG